MHQAPSQYVGMEPGLNGNILMMFPLLYFPFFEKYETLTF